MTDLNSFPVLMLRNGRPELEGGWHEEMNVRYKISPQTTIEVAGFHDQKSRDTPVFWKRQVRKFRLFAGSIFKRVCL